MTLPHSVADDRFGTSPLSRSESAVRDLLAAERPEALVRRDRRFDSPLPVRLLIRRARAAGPVDPREALRVADLAVSIAGRVNPGVWGSEAVVAIRCEARASRVEALLHLGEPGSAAGEARELVTEADERIGARLRGDLHLVAAHVARGCGELEEAAGLLMAARGFYETTGDDSRLGRALLQLGEVYREHGQVDLAVDATRRSIACFEDGRDREAERCARHNLAIYLCDAGRPGEAWKELERSKELLGEGVESAVLLSSQWVEGRIREEIDEVDAAEGLYRRVRKGFLELGDVHKAVLVSLDLAGLWIEDGRPQEAGEVATWLEAVCRSESGLKEVAVEAVGLREAIREQEPNVGLLRRLARLRSLVR